MLPSLITSSEISQMIAIEVVALANKMGSTSCQFDKVLLELPNTTDRTTCLETAHEGSMWR